jgi:predicted transcriptional regulator
LTLEEIDSSLDRKSQEDSKMSYDNDYEEYSRIDSLIQMRMRSRKGRKIRPRSKILIAILEACRTPSVEHWIMIKARLGYETFWMHVNRLLNEGKVALFRNDDGRGNGSKTYYTLTREGLQMLEELKSEQN